MESCKTCRFIHAGEVKPDLTRDYACRRFPPGGVVAVSPRGEQQTIAFLIPVRLNGWCGEWKPVDTEAQAALTR
jgi:hypothetical protein